MGSSSREVGVDGIVTVVGSSLGVGRVGVGMLQANNNITVIKITYNKAPMYERLFIFFLYLELADEVKHGTARL